MLYRDLRKVDLDFHYNKTIGIEIDGIEHYYENLNSFINNEIETAIGESENSSEDAELVYYSMWHHVYENLNLSFIMLLVSFIEKHFDFICELIRVRKGIAITRKDLTGGVFASTKKYLRWFGGFENPKDEDWNILEAIYDVRNVIIHGGGYISRARLGSMRKLNLLKNMKVGITFWFGDSWDMKDGIKPPMETDKIEFSQKFCLFAIDRTKIFFDKLKNEHTNKFCYLRPIK